MYVVYLGYSITFVHILYMLSIYFNEFFILLCDRIVILTKWKVIAIKKVDQALNGNFKNAIL